MNIFLANQLFLQLRTKNTRGIKFLSTFTHHCIWFQVSAVFNMCTQQWLLSSVLTELASFIQATKLHKVAFEFAKYNAMKAYVEWRYSSTQS